MNVRLLRRVKKHILEEPRRFFMEWFILRKNKDRQYVQHGFPSCGTVGCIAGWTCLLAHGMKFTGNEWGEARKLLGLTEMQAVRLFSMHAAPSQFVRMYASDGSRETAEVGAKRIEHFIKTKGRE